MYNVFFKILISIIVLSTLCILGLKPKMHNKVLMYNSEYSIVESEPEDTQDMVIPEKEQVQVVKNTVSNEVKQEVQKKIEAPKKVETVKTVVEPKKEIKTVSSKNEIKQPQKEVTKVAQQPVKVEVKQVTKEPAKTVATKVVEPIKQPKPTVKTEPIGQQKTTTVQKTQDTPKTKVLTQQEEEIAWNIWRSNLQNQIMKDTKLPYIPKGTVFKFSFDVDKYGRISNIKTWSLTPNYTPYAIQYIAPVIRSYQGKDILDFPEGTQRITTNFVGGWKISDNAKYSTPNDYNDIEKVKR